MAFVTLQASKKTLSKTEDISDYLHYHGITYKTWEVPKRLSPFVKKDLLSPEEKSQVLAAYTPQLEELKTSKGYIENDMVCLCPTTPQINELLSKFDKDHYHTDDEVRFIFSGRGIFGFEGKKQEKFTIEVVGGDYIVIPAYNWHWFTLGENRDLKAIRLFQDQSGWVPHYRQGSEAPPVPAAR
jgi:1,2-dihydroxy-3-keto-5-methylthiopentene dioxygenase